MSSNGSFIVLPAAKVAALAQAHLANIERENAQMVAYEVSKERKRQEKNWFRRLFRLKIDSPEDIEARLLASTDWLSLSTTLRMHSWDSREVAERLLKAATYSDMVSVTTADLDMIATVANAQTYRGA